MLQAIATTMDAPMDMPSPENRGRCCSWCRSLRVSINGSTPKDPEYEPEHRGVFPHALGLMKVASEDDPLLGEARARNEFLIAQRHHANAAPQTNPPRSAARMPRPAG